MYYTQNIRNIDVASVIKAANVAVRKIISENLATLSMPTESKIKEIESASSKIKQSFDNLVILGTGGSTLTGQALYGLVKTQREFENTSPKIHFMDNVDPHEFSMLLCNIDVKKTCFLVISKSGSTLETLSQFFLCLSTVERAAPEKEIKNHFLIITDSKDSPLRRVGKKIGITIFNHEPDIGGRFSIFTNVALLPAAVAGIDIRSVIKGASAVIESGLCENSKQAKGSAFNVSGIRSGKNIAVMIPYVDRLSKFTEWVRQIWAESLGKGGFGSTFITARGTLDQHSQLQLYLDGPQDKIFTFITCSEIKEYSKITHRFLENENLSYLNNKTLADVMRVSASATIDILTSKNLPTRAINIAKLNEESIGALAAHFILETLITAEIAKINPFDQPAVEGVKILARNMLEKHTEKQYIN